MRIAVAVAVAVAVTVQPERPLISILFFQPNQRRLSYSKQLLHDDEFPFFSPGNEQAVLTVADTKIAPEINLLRVITAFAHRSCEGTQRYSLLS